MDILGYRVRPNDWRQIDFDVRKIEHPSGRDHRLLFVRYAGGDMIGGPKLSTHVQWDPRKAAESYGRKFVVTAWQYAMPDDHPDEHPLKLTANEIIHGVNEHILVSLVMLLTEGSADAGAVWTRILELRKEAPLNAQRQDCSLRGQASGPAPAYGNHAAHPRNN